MELAVKKYNALVLLACSVGPLGNTLKASTLADIVFPEFENAIVNTAEVAEPDGSTSAVFFSGHIGSYVAPDSGQEAAVPAAADTGLSLTESAMGQAFSSSEPYSDFVTTQIQIAQDILYPAQGLTREQIEGSDASFRYKPLLFGTDSEGATSLNFEGIEDWYGDPERASAENAIEFLATGLKVAPGDKRLRNAILDAYYDLAVAETQFIKIKQGTLSEWRLGFLPDPEGGFIVNEEISLYESIIEDYRFVLGEYKEFLSREFSQDVSHFDEDAPAGIPFGAFVFQDQQPERNQNAMTFVDEDGLLKTVPDYDPEAGDPTPSEEERVLLSGYKDYALVATLLRDYGDAAAELARLYGLRKLKDSENDDIQKGLNTISQVQQDLFTSIAFLRGILPDYEPVAADGTGIAETLNGIKVAQADLNSAKVFLQGSANALGFDPDFLVLIQEFPDSTEGNQFDSYDAMIRWIRNTSTSPLNFAESAYNTAFTNYEKYKGFADQLFNELSGINTTMSQRYFEITGYDPEEPGNHREEPREGSELFLIESAIEQLETKSEQLRQLDAQIDGSLVTAENSVSTAEGLRGSIDNALNSYQGTISTQRDVITKWNKNQAISQASYDTVSDVASMSKADDLLFGGWIGVGATAVAGAVNIHLQGRGEQRKGDAEKALDLAGAEFEAALEANDTELVVNQAIENRDSLRREKISNTLQTLDNDSLLSQEVARRAAAYRELDRLVNNRESTVEGLANRYYADPIHYLRSQNDMIKADNAFREAQEWVFYTLRALEFKWNKDFEISYLDKDWSLETLFKLRNFLELNEMVGALEQFNTVNLVGFNREAFVDKISIRDDVLAPNPRSGEDDGLRFDFETGETVSPTELMRRKLDRSRDGDGNIVIRLDTFSLDKNDGFFFLGPDYRSDGSVLSAGKYLDKIDWIKLNAVTSEPSVVKTAILSYSGTCYVRNRVPPCATGGNPFELNGEYRKFPFRYFYTLDNGANWLTRSDQQDTVKMLLSSEPTEPEKGVSNSTLENNFLKERSVAATDLIITIPQDNIDLSKLDDFEIYINHLFVSREVPNCN